MNGCPTRHSNRIRLRPRRLHGLLATSLALLAGCGGSEVQLPKAEGEPVPAKGKVLLPSGQPLAGGRVIFVPAKPPGVEAQGKTGEDGGFQLTSRQENDGALPGDYKVKIEPPVSAKGVAKPGRVPFATEYLDEDASGLTATVGAGQNSFEFKLKASLPGAGKRRGGRE